MTVSTIDKILDEAQNGRMFILVDDEDRENEGDLVIPAQYITPSAINFMATHGRGIICLALDSAQSNQLNLHLQPRQNTGQFDCAFTVSIDARHGIGTGTSAPDRAQTVLAAIASDAKPDDITTPGHIFPVLARDGGVLVRAGHTEASVDISRLCGFTSAAVICEIMTEDGEMARLTFLKEFAKTHDMKIGTIADLIAHRRKIERTVFEVTPKTERLLFPFTNDAWKMHIFQETHRPDKHIALVYGDISSEKTVAVRVHSVNIFADMLWQHDGEYCRLQDAVNTITDHGNGVILLMRNSSHDEVERLNGTTSSHDAKFRHFGTGAQILTQLGVKNMLIISASRQDPIALESYGLNIDGYLDVVRADTSHS